MFFSTIDPPWKFAVCLILFRIFFLIFFKICFIAIFFYINYYFIFVLIIYMGSIREALLLLFFLLNLNMLPISWFYYLWLVHFNCLEYSITCYLCSWELHVKLTHNFGHVGLFILRQHIFESSDLIKHVSVGHIEVLVIFVELRQVVILMKTSSGLPCLLEFVECADLGVHAVYRIGNTLVHFFC